MDRKKILVLQKLSLLIIILGLISCGNSRSSNNENTTSGKGSNASSENNGKKITLSIADAVIQEGGILNFSVTANPTIAEPLNFSYLVDFTNQLNPASKTDLGTVTGAFTIAANIAKTIISIPTVNDVFPEKDETFNLVLKNLSLIDVTFNNIGRGTILANDPFINIDNSVGKEGDYLNFKVTTIPIIAEPIIFKYHIDFTNQLNPANSFDLSSDIEGEAVIATGASNATISIPIADDNIREDSETFLIVLDNLAPSDTSFFDNIGLGTISADNDNIIFSSVAPVMAKEASGEAVFKVISNFPATAPVTFNYEATVDNTLSNSASANNFTAISGISTIAANDSSTTISIPIIDDGIKENNKTFRLLLSNPVNVIFDSTSTVGTILNDDPGEISNFFTSARNNKISLRWINPSSSFFAGVTIAYLNSNTAPQSCKSATNITTIDAMQKTEHTVTGLTNGVSYSLRICTRNITNRLSAGAELTNFIAPITDGDNDGDGLIDIYNIIELNNIRYNLAGTSYKTSSDDTGDTSGCPTNGCNGYELIKSIDLSKEGFTDWEPVGDNNNRFKAIFEGNGNIISNFNIDKKTFNNVGLFAVLEDATVRNLKLAGVRLAGNTRVGALAGYAINSSLFNIELIGDNSQSSSDAEIKGDLNVGGLVGQFSGTITDSSSSLTIASKTNVGGLVGHLLGMITTSHSTGAIFSTNNTGGLVGYQSGAAIINQSWASGHIYGDSGAGGLVGEVAFYNNIISQSWASGNVSGYVQVGGLVGLLRGTISQSWASGNVSGTGEIGGLAGIVANNIDQNGGSISQSWASGNVSGRDYIGGLTSSIGRNNNIIQVWASGEVLSSTNSEYAGSLVGWSHGNTIGRNYQLDGPIGFGILLANQDGIGDSFDLANLQALADLSGADIESETASDWLMNSGWHTGFDISNPSNTNIADFDLNTRFCDTDNDGTIDIDEQLASNSVWVMGPATNDVAAPTTDTAGNETSYHQIPALRCIGTTPAERQESIDRQRRLFPQR